MMTFAALLSLIVAVLVAGVVVYLADALPLEQPFKNAIRLLVILALLLYLLRVAGMI